MGPFRFGLFHYLNVRPLVHGLRAETGSRLVLDTPARIAARFRAGELDVAMIPSLEAASLEAPAAVVDGIAVGSDGPVETVLLAHRVPLSGCRRLVLDESSRTSAALAKILIAEASGRLPETRTWSPADPAAAIPAEADAALVIGDPAFSRLFDPGFEVLDLGAAWRTLTGLPFVFAVAVASSREIAATAQPVLRRALDSGLADLDAVFAGAPPPVDAARARRYLQESIRFGFGPREREGYEAFLTRARRHGLL